jgi:hypothetical protein
METLEFEYRGGRTALTRNKPVLSGVLGSGNLEVLVEPEPHRVFRRLLILEGWSHDQAYSPVFS